MPQHTPEEQAKNQAQLQTGPEVPVQSDLGQSLTPQQQQPAPAGVSNAAGEFFDDPVNKAGLLSFGLNLLQGGFGTPVQQFAQAAGAGIESAAGAEAFQTEQRRKDEDQDFKERQLGQRADIARGVQAGALERAKIAAKSRAETFGLRGSLANKFTSTYTSAFKLRMDQLKSFLDPDQGATPAEKEAISHAFAQRTADKTFGATEKQFPGSTRGQGAIGGGQTSPIPPSGAAPPQVPQPGGAPGQSTPNAQGGAQLESIDKFRARLQASGLPPATIQQRLQQLEVLKSTPEGQEDLRRRGIDPLSEAQSAIGAGARGAGAGIRTALSANPVGLATNIVPGILEGINRIRGQ